MRAVTYHHGDHAKGEKAMENVNTANLVNEIRDLCIKNNWFTSGDNSEYNSMFDFIRKNGELNGIGETFQWFCRQITWRIVDCTPEQTHENVMFFVVGRLAPYYFNY